MAERENRDTARSLNVVHLVDRDLDVAAPLAAGVVDRATANEGSPAFLAVMPSADDALAFSEAVLGVRKGSTTPLMPVTSLARARRLLGSGATALAAAPAQLSRLVGDSRLDFAGLHTLMIVWPEEILGDEEQRALLEGILSEVPKSAERVAICAERTPALVQFIERSMWRARELDHRTAAAPPMPVTLRVIAVPPSERLRAVRSVLDAFDPDAAVLLTFSDEGERAAQDAATLLGGGHLVTVSRGSPDRRYSLGIIFDDVPDGGQLNAVSDAVDEIVAVVRPSRLSALQRITGSLTPISWTGALANARSAHDALRDEIRGYAGSGAHSAWIPIVEPLLEGLDPVDIAAAALALLDRERRKSRRPAQPVPDARAASRDDRPPSRSARDDRPPASRRERDERPSGSRPGEQERRFVKKRPWDSRNAGESQRGARRPGADRPAHGRGGHRGDDRPFTRGERRGDDRPFNRGERRGEDRPFGRGERRRDEIERMPRAAHEGREWSERGERLRNSRGGNRPRHRPGGGEPG